MERKIASNDTNIVSSPNGKGSIVGKPRTPVFHMIQTVNQTPCTTRKNVELAMRTKRSAICSARDPKLCVKRERRIAGVLLPDRF
jgi:hypothetical protein